MSFTTDVKEEIVHNEYSSNQEAKILKAYLMSNMELSLKDNEETWNIFSTVPFILKFLHNILSKSYSIKKQFYYSEVFFGKHKKYRMSVNGELERIQKELDIYSEIKDKLSEEDAVSYLIGFFLSIGSVNSPKSSTYHLEFRVKNNLVYDSICHCLDKIKVEYKVIDRKGNKIIYFKKSEMISDFLKIIGAINSMFVFEDSRIQKDFTNQIHRLNNLDISNIKKTVTSTEELKHSIQIIFEDEDKKAKLNKNEILFCELKIKNPELSLQDIAAIFNDEYKIDISKSGLNHYSRKIRKLAQE